jgi:hypothetical protein
MGRLADDQTPVRLRAAPPSISKNTPPLIPQSRRNYLPLLPSQNTSFQRACGNCVDTQEPGAYTRPTPAIYREETHVGERAECVSSTCMSYDGLVALSTLCDQWKGRSLCLRTRLTSPISLISIAPNRLYFGDNLNVLRAHIADATVDLCYIDPPFNSKRNYNQIYGKVGAEDRAQAQAFVDTWTWDTIAEQGSAKFLTMRRGVSHDKQLI